MDLGFRIVISISYVFYTSCLISEVSGWGWGGEDEDEEEITTTQKPDEYLGSDDDLQSLNGWRQNILVVSGLVLLIGGTIAILYCCCKICGPPPEDVEPSTQRTDPERGDNNERFPRDSFYQPPPRYSALIRSQSQRKARLDLLKKKEEEDGELPRYSAAVRQISSEDTEDGITATTPILIGTEVTEESMVPNVEHNETSPLNPLSGSLESIPSERVDLTDFTPLRHAASCSDLLDSSPMQNVIMRKKRLQRTNSDPPRYSNYQYESTPKL